MTYNDPDKQRKYQRIWRKNRNKEEKLKSFKLLGNKCAKCGIEDHRVLQIDHIKALRRKDRLEVYYESGVTLKQRISNGSRKLDNLQLLCANCHQIKTFEDLYGIAND